MIATGAFVARALACDAQVAESCLSVMQAEATYNYMNRHGRTTALVDRGHLKTSRHHDHPGLIMQADERTEFTKSVCGMRAVRVRGGSQFPKLANLKRW